MSDHPPTLCRDCPAIVTPAPEQPDRCPQCGSRRLVSHADLLCLSIAHIDCDAFFASVEKQRRPELAGKPLLIGGTGERGVVSTACYIARLTGARSAMPMRQARGLCPDAVILPPDIRLYREVAQQVRSLMEEITPLFEVKSIDEAALDLAGTETLHNAPPCVVLARLALKIERTLGITISIGLAANTLMAKLAASIDKPRGFGVIGREARQWLADKPLNTLPGIGAAQEKTLRSLGFTRLGALAALSDADALRRLGPRGPILAARARGETSSTITPVRPTKSVSVETTFDRDLSRQDALLSELWLLCDQLATRLRRKGLAATGLSLKLRTNGFKTRTRALRFAAPSVLPDRLFEQARDLFLREWKPEEAIRLIGIGTNGLAPLSAADQPDLTDTTVTRSVAMQGAVDALRDRFGAKIIGKGRGRAPVSREKHPGRAK